MITNSAAIARIAIHAPARNFVTTTMISTVPVQMKPTALITRDRIMWRRTAESVSVRSSRVQRLRPGFQRPGVVQLQRLGSGNREARGGRLVVDGLDRRQV